MAFGRKKDKESENVAAPKSPIKTYDVIYRGGLRELPKAKSGKIRMEIWPDHFKFVPTATSKFWLELSIPYLSISDLKIVERTVSTFEGIAGGLNSKQLNQKNNIHVAFAAPGGVTLLRLEMLSGITVMGQAKKCNELEDLLLTSNIREQFAEPKSPAAAIGSLSEDLTRLASLRDSGALSEDEFASAKARLLSA